LRTIPMRAVVTNILVKSLSKTFNSCDFQAKCVLRSFQKSYDQNTPETMELHCPDDLFSSRSESSSDEDDEVAALREQVATLTRINNDLFNFVAGKIVETKSKSDSLKSDVKNEKRKRKRKIKS